MPSTRTGPVVLDGAMGTTLLARGLEPGSVPEAWLAARPEMIAAVHAAHVGAGAEVVLTCTFNLASPRLGSLAVNDCAARAVALARASGAARVAGAVGPTGLRGGFDRWYAPAFEALAAAGADLLWAETQWSLAEATAALAAARRCGLPAAVTLAFTDGEPAALPGGEPVEEALVTLAGGGAAAAGVGCVFTGERLERLVARVAPRLAIPLIVKPSPGLPGAVLAPEPFAAGVRRLTDAGASWAGGCCGAGAAHVRALAQALRG